MIVQLQARISNMHCYRMIYTILGLILIAQSVLCRTCGSDFDDVYSRGYQAGIVFEGSARELSTPVNYRLNVTFDVSKVLKGKFPDVSEDEKKIPPIIVGSFGVAKNDLCLPKVSKDKKYIVFLNSTRAPNGLYQLSSHPVVSNKKFSKQVRDVVCNGCAKKAKIRFIKPTKVKVKVGTRIQMRCRVTGMPPPVIVWAKDGEILSKTKSRFIKSNKKGSKLRIKKAGIKDEGIYECQASNLLGFESRKVNVTVTGAKPKVPKNGEKNMTLHYSRCSADKQHYCLHGGTCLYSPALDTQFCQCQQDFIGARCQYRDLWEILREIKKEDDRQFDRSMTIAGIVVGVLVLLAICIGAYFMSRKRRREFYERKKKKVPTATLR